MRATPASRIVIRSRRFKRSSKRLVESIRAAVRGHRQVPRVARQTECPITADMDRAISAVGLSDYTSTVEAGATDRAGRRRCHSSFAEAGRSAVGTATSRVPSEAGACPRHRLGYAGHATSRLGRLRRLGEGHDTGFRVVSWTYICPGIAL